MEAHLKDARRGERTRSGIGLAIVGRPNAGKSTFLNRVVGRDAAIVSPTPGTTRDVVEVSLDLGGYPINLSDTAGLRPTQDSIEREGIKRAIGQLERADLALFVVDASEALKDLTAPLGFDSFLADFFRQAGIVSCSSEFALHMSEKKYECLTNQMFLILVNKVDLLRVDEKTKLLEAVRGSDNVRLVSLKTSEGLNDVLEKMKAMCADLCVSDSVAESPHLTSQRHRTHIEASLQHLQAILGDPSDAVDDEVYRGGVLDREETLVLAAQRMQLASNQLGYVTGQITTEDILDHIFSSFCIGK